MLHSIVKCVCVCLILLNGLGCSRKDGPPPLERGAEEEGQAEEGMTKVRLSKDALETLDLQLETVEKQPVYQEIVATGKVVQGTEKMSFVFTPSSGMVREILVQVGESVQKGQSLLKVGGMTLKAPRSGTVLSVNASPGSHVGTLDSLVTIADIDTIRGVLDIYPKDMDKIALGQKVEVTLIGHEGETYPGIIQYLSPSLDDLSQTFKVGADLQNIDHHLKFGMFLEAKILSKVAEEGVVVPDEAVVRFDGEFAVFVPGEEEGSFIKRSVKIGARGNGMVQILEGLQEAERVVTRGGFTLKGESLKGSFGEG